VKIFYGKKFPSTAVKSFPSKTSSLMLIMSFHFNQHKLILKECIRLRGGGELITIISAYENFSLLFALQMLHTHDVVSQSAKSEGTALEEGSVRTTKNETFVNFS
jgi:hypothetical protein